MIKTKQEMYTLLASGALGNTSPMWADIIEWSKQSRYNQLYGIRTMTPGGPCYMNLETWTTGILFHKLQRQGYTPQISCMVDQWRTGIFNVMRTELGLCVEGVLCCDSQQTWRELMANQIKWFGVVANEILKHYMNANSYDDLQILLDKYPNHVIELTTLNRCFGTVPHRNSIVWEVRMY